MADVYQGIQTLTKVAAGVISPTTISPPTQNSVNFGVGIYENATTITNSYTITNGSGGFSAGPIKLADGVVVRIPDGSSWTIR
jgi:hypothetical protein